MSDGLLTASAKLGLLVLPAVTVSDRFCVRAGPPATVPFRVICDVPTGVSAPVLMVRVTLAGLPGNRRHRTGGLERANRARGQSAAGESHGLVERPGRGHLKCDRPRNAGLAVVRLAGRRRGQIEIHHVQGQSEIASGLVGVGADAMQVEQVVADRTGRIHREGGARDRSV